MMPWSWSKEIFGKGSIMRLGERAEQKFKSWALVHGAWCCLRCWWRSDHRNLWSEIIWVNNRCPPCSSASTEKKSVLPLSMPKHALNPCSNSQVNVDELLLSQPDSGWDLKLLVNWSTLVRLIWWLLTLLRPMVPRAGDGDIGDNHVGCKRG